jgi:large subunit ribosomal protein L29
MPYGQTQVHLAFRYGTIEYTGVEYMKASELRQMSGEQLAEMLKATEENFFRLQMQARMERLDVPSELKKNRRLIARILTVQRQRELAANNV